MNRTSSLKSFLNPQKQLETHKPTVLFDQKYTKLRNQGGRKMLNGYFRDHILFFLTNNIESRLLKSRGIIVFSAEINNSQLFLYVSTLNNDF